MELIFKCRTSLNIPRGGSLSLGRRKPIPSWDNVLISRNHVQLNLPDDGSTLGLLVTGRNAVVVERQRREGGGWDVVTVVDPGGSAQLPLNSLGDNHATRFFILGAREESAIELRPTAAAQGPPMEPTHTPPAKRQRLSPPRAADSVTTGSPGAQAAASPRPAAVKPTSALGAASGAGGGDAPPSAAAGPAAREAAAVPRVKAASAADPADPAAAQASGAGTAGRSGGISPRSLAAEEAEAEAEAVPAAARTSKDAGTSSAAAAAPPREATPNDAVPYDIESPVHMLRVRGLAPRCNEGCLGARLGRLLSGPMQVALVSNYMVDMGWLLSACPDLARAAQFFVVHGEPPDAEAEMRQQAAAAGAPHVVLHRPPLPIAYGTHHSKAFLVTYPTGLRLVVHTANCVSPDCNDKSQGLWVQDFPRKDAATAAAVATTHGSVAASPFERDLAAYFRALALPAAMAGAVLDAIAAHDFSFARGSLVSSVPGYHRGNAVVQLYGHMRLRRLLEQVPLPAGFQGSGAPAAASTSSSSTSNEGVVIQCSSMGSFDQAWLIDEFGASLAAFRRPDQLQQPSSPQQRQQQRQQQQQVLLTAPPRPSGPPGSEPLPLAIVWPTVEEVRNSIEGWNAGRSIPGPTRNVNKPFMGRYYVRWGGEAVGRQRAMPHIKTYTRYRGQQLAWFLVTSHNLSKAAWGELQKNGSQIMIRSYELGVLVTPALEAAYRSSPQFGFCCTRGDGNTRQQPRAVQPVGPAATAVPAPQGRRVTFWSLPGATTAGSSSTRGESSTGNHSDGEVICAIPVPYTLPPMSYRAGQDKPWAVDTPQAGLDALGLPWGAPYSHYGHTQVD